MVELETRKLHPVFGVEVIGFEARPLDAESCRALRSLFDERGLLLFRNFEIDLAYQNYLSQVLIGADPASIDLSAHCHRVATVDGHLEAVSVEFERAATPAAVREAFESFVGESAYRELPSSSDRPIVVRDEPDRPQPRLDRDTGGGMAVVVGRIRPCAVLGMKFVLLSHNTVRGAAGGTLLNAELLAARGLLPRRAGA